MIRLITESLSESQFSVSTVGLASTIEHAELRVEISDSVLAGEAEGFLRYVSDYLTTCNRQILPGETMAYGYWLVKFEEAGPHTLETWEHDPECKIFVKGADLALSYWRDQHQVCSQYSAEFKPPRLDQMSVVSKGVFEDLPIKAVRYPSPDHMSGWWFITEQYDGNIKSLTTEHIFHVTAARPELAKLLALPNGFRFHSETRKAWFDEEVATATL